MALTADRNLKTHGSAEYGDLEVLDGATVYKGALVALVVGTGTVTNYDDAANHIPLGYATKHVVGDGVLKIPIQIDDALILNSVTVTGVAAATDNGAAVYATDENTFSLTRPADDAHVIGLVLFWRTSTTCDVLLLGARDAAVLALAGGNKERVHLATVHTTQLEGTSADDIRASIPMWGHGKIVDFYAYATGYDTALTAGSQTLNLEIGGTNVTGGTLGLSFGAVDAAADMGAKISAAAITAANEFHDGDLLDIEVAASGTAFSLADTVSFELYADIEYIAGA